MYRIRTFNKISPVGLNRLDSALYAVSDSETDEDAILVRSAKLLDYDFPKNLLAISRAGAGVNNIPLDRCSEAGIVVFNTPGANANAVKELILAGMLISSRKVIDAIEWAKTLKGQGAEVTKLVEKGKAQFAGPEIKGKKLGVIGDYTGALGIMTITPSEGAIIGADVAMKAANVEVVFVDRFNGSLIINGTVADVEAAVKDVLNVLENTLHFAPTVITKS